MKSTYLAMSIFCALGLLPAHADTSSESTSDKPLAFNEVNQQLLKNYTAAKQELHKKLGPLVLCMDSSLTLINGNKREKIPFIKQHYTGLKEISHITLGTFVLLVNHTDENISDDTIAKLKEYKSGIEKASPEVPTNEGLLRSDEARQTALIERTLGFLDKSIKERRVSAAELQSYVRSTSVPDLENAYIAVASQMSSMDKAMAKWRQELTPEEWDNMYVFIATAHMPRQQLIAYQYFAKLLHQSQEGDRVIVGENPGTTTEEQAIDLVLTHILDRKIAVQFFNDPWRMHRDLLSDAGKKWLKEHKLEASH
ncbi:MAG: hypothetical protein JST89_03720 [Cyanobacteria bacterium SZAS-4]|nr:hypothetical protein [Cyanobacteria bacterium SZAS-4]